MVAPPPGWLAVSLAVAGVQFCAAARLLWRSRRPAKRDNAPSACVIVPFKGRTYPDNVKAFLEQEYPGPLSWRFVVADARDPAVAQIPREHLLVSGALPRESSEKCLNLIAGVEASADAELLLFADADVKVGPHWARHLASALLDSGATMATAALLPAPEGGPSLLRAAWLAAGLSWFEPLCVGVGQSLALRRSDYEKLDVKRLWSRAVSDDLSLSNAVRRAGGRTILVPHAAPLGRGGDWSQSVAQFTKWLTLFKYEMPHVWWPGAVAVLIKAGAVWQALSGPFCPALLGVVLLGDAATLFTAVTALDSWRRAVAVSLCAPLLLLCHAWNYLASAFHREIVWAGWTYHLDDSRAERGAVPALYARRRRFLRLACAGLGAALAGMAYWPGRWGWLAWLGFAPLLMLLEGERPARAFAWGLLYGSARWLAGLPWMYGFIAGFLRTGPPETCVWLAALAATQSLRWGLVSALTAAVPRQRLAVFVLSALLAELYWPAIFPEPLAYTQLFQPALLQTLSFWPLLPAALILLFNAGLASRRPALLLAAGALAFGLQSWGRGEMGRAAARTLRVAALQGLGDGRYADASPSAPLVVWPEGVFTGRLDALPRLPSPTLLTAHHLGKNLAALVLPDGFTSAEKEMLVPFGERMPAGLAWLRRLSPKTGALAPGVPSGTMTLPGGEQVGTMICYENLFPARGLHLAALGADLLVTQARSSWSDSRRAAEMHARFGALRALETRRAVLHAADAGPTVLYAPDGRELARRPWGEPGLLLADAPLPEAR